MFRMNATIPQKLHYDDWIRSMKFMSSETASDIRTDFEITARTFEKPVKFNKRGWVAGGQVRVSVTTDDENYKRLNDGVKGGYLIPKDGPGILVFQPTYNRKTHPHLLKLGIIYPSDGGPEGEVIIRHTQIVAKGFPGRHFDQAIQERWEEILPYRVLRALSVPFGEHMSPSLIKAVKIWRNKIQHELKRREL